MPRRANGAAPPAPARRQVAVASPIAPVGGASPITPAGGAPARSRQPESCVSKPRSGRRTPGQVADDLVAQGAINECAGRDSYCSNVKCGMECLQHLDFKERKAFILQRRQIRNAIPGRHRTEHVVEQLHATHTQRGVDVAFGPFHCGGEMLCVDAWRAIHEWGDCAYFTARKQAMESIVANEPLHGTLDDTRGDDLLGKRSSEASKAATGWLRMRLDDEADGKDPASGRRMIDKIDHDDWYAEYCVAMGDRGSDVVKSRTFRNRLKEVREEMEIWNRKWVPFSKCGTCVDLKTELRAATTEHQRTKVRETRMRHLRHQASMRQVYYSHKENAWRFPEDYMSCIADGMDQAKVQMPWLREKSKGITKTLDCALEGVYFHGMHERMDFYVVPHTYKGGSNVTVHCLNESIKRQIAHMKAAGKKTPHTLYVQLDNTTKENKNQYVEAYLSSLVTEGVFDVVVMTFLPVGHTHEDIDQRFSVVSRKLRREVVLSVQAFKALLESLFKDDSRPPQVTLVPYVWDFAAWVRPHINVGYAQFQSVQKYHQYRFTRHEEVARMHMREWPHEGCVWFPPKHADGATHECHGIDLLPGGRALLSAMQVSAMEGRFSEAKFDGIVECIKAAAKKYPATWHHDTALSVDDCPVVKDWRDLKRMVPFRAADVDENARFEWPPMRDVSDDPAAPSSADAADPMGVEKALPHARFSDVDENKRRVEQAQNRKVQAVWKKGRTKHMARLRREGQAQIGGAQPLVPVNVRADQGEDIGNEGGEVAGDAPAIGDGGCDPHGSEEDDNEEDAEEEDEEMPGEKWPMHRLVGMDGGGKAKKNKDGEPDDAYILWDNTGTTYGIEVTPVLLTTLWRLCTNVTEPKDGEDGVVTRKQAQFDERLVGKSITSTHIVQGRIARDSSGQPKKYVGEVASYDGESGYHTVKYGKQHGGRAHTEEMDLFKCRGGGVLKWVETEFWELSLT